MNSATEPAANRLLRDLDRAIEEKHLLKHPFYQAWTAGDLSLDALRGYSVEYYRQVEAFPLYLGAAYSRCENVESRRQILENLVEEDSGPDNHLELWLRFAEGLGVDRDEVESAEPLPETKDCVHAMRELTLNGSTVESMAAIYAYEAMVPEISEQKIDGLVRRYGIDDERTLSFFREHEQADREHREWDRDLLVKMCESEEDADSCLRAATVSLDSLWKLLDGVSRVYVQ